MSTRVLVVDGSRLMAWLVAHVAPTDVDVVHAATLAEAERILLEAPPEAAIFNVTPSQLEWRTLLRHCTDHAPPIPYLCTSVLDEPELACVGLSCRDPEFISKSIPVFEFRDKVVGLVERARAAARTGCPDPTAPLV